MFCDENFFVKITEKEKYLKYINSFLIMMDEDGVSEIIGVLLLLGISVGLFSVVYYSILSTEPAPRAPPLNVISTIDDKNLTILHAGGEPIDLDTRIIVTVDGATSEDVIENYLDASAKSNNKWDMGEEIIYYVGDVSGKTVDVSLVENKSNSLILLVTLHG